MRLYVAWVPSMDVPFSPAAHAVDDSRWLSVEMIETEDQAAEIEIVREQTGWSQLSQDQPKAVLISWSPTGLPADAVLLARGQIRDMPSDLFSVRQTLRIVCAPKDVDDRLLAYAKAHLTEVPFWEPLMSDADDEDPASYLVARPEVYHVDPATHVVSTVSEVVGERVLDMTDVALFGGGKSTDSAGDGGKLVRTLRAKLSVGWTQTATGICDIGKHVELVGLDTLDPGFGNNLQGMLSGDGTEGWSSGGAFRASVTWSGTVPVAVAEYSSRSWQQSGSAGDYEIRSHTLMGQFKRFQVSGVSMPLTFEYRQDREEVVYCALDLPLQTTGLEADADDVVDLSLKDIFLDPAIDDYEPGKDYVADDLRRNNGSIYRCVADHYSTAFGMVRPNPPATGLRTYWALVDDGSEVDAGLVSFADTAKGQAVIVHVLHRLRKEALRRLRFRRVRLTFAWADAIGVTMKDSMRFDVPWGSGATRSVVGKVISIRRTWPEGSPPVIEVEVGVSFGKDAAPVGSDIGFTTSADPVQKPVAAERLGDHHYSVVRMRALNRAARQLGAVPRILAAGGDPRDCSVEFPTSVEVQMRSLAPASTLRREIDVVGTLRRAPQGVTLA